MIVKDGESELKVPQYESYEARTRITCPVQSVNIVTEKKDVKAFNDTTKWPDPFTAFSRNPK